ncbi:MAG: hypothetical protein RLZZ630_1241 [Bacteroidota bacterium]
MIKAVSNLKYVALEIAGKTYPLRVNEQQESELIQAAQTVNRRLKEYEKAFGVRDIRDLLAMCALHLSAEHQRMQQQKSEVSDTLHLDLDALAELAKAFQTA